MASLILSVKTFDCEQRQLFGTERNLQFSTFLYEERVNNSYSLQVRVMVMKRFEQGEKKIIKELLSYG